MSTNQASQIRKEFVPYQVCLKVGMGCHLKSCIIITEGINGQT